MRMRLFKNVLSIAVLCLAATLSLGDTLSAQDVAPGVDLWVTPPDGNTYMDFAVTSVPADFFGPGSDPFDGVVPLQGEPLNTSPPDLLGPTDTIVKRTESATLPACGASDPIEIELVALSLVSIDPVTVTYNGGQNPELWDLGICLSSSASQDPGSMTITKGCDEGGTFTAELLVRPKFTFTRVGEPWDIRVFDFGNEGYPSIPLETSDGHWLYSDPGFGIITSPGGDVDHDCNPDTGDIPFGLSSNFFPGLQGLPCDCVNNPTEHNIVLTYFLNPSLIVGHGVLPPQLETEPVYDLWETPEDYNTYVEFGCGPSTPPIPADFFGPGSDPFTGNVVLRGEPLTATPDVLGPTDTIIKRSRVADLPQCPSSDQIEVEIVALSLVSVAPIIVTYNGGQDPESWDVEVCLSSSPQLPGSMTINQVCQEGGTFTADIPVLPLFTFTEVDPPHNQVYYDLGLDGAPPIPYDITDGHWLFTDPSFGIYTSPGEVQVDNCGDDGALIGQSAVDLIPGLRAIPCIDCNAPAEDHDIPITSLVAPDNCAQHDVWPPHDVVEAIPTLSEWGMLIMGLLLLSIATVAVVRRRKAAISRAA